MPGYAGYRPQTGQQQVHCCACRRRVASKYDLLPATTSDFLLALSRSCSRCGGGDLVCPACVAEIRGAEEKAGDVVVFRSSRVKGKRGRVPKHKRYSDERYGAFCRREFRSGEDLGDKLYITGTVSDRDGGVEEEECLSIKLRDGVYLHLLFGEGNAGWRPYLNSSEEPNCEFELTLPPDATSADVGSTMVVQLRAVALANLHMGDELLADFYDTSL